MSKVFIDSNILLYAMAHGDSKKKQTCIEALKSIQDELKGVISTQVMQEFYVVATKKLGVDPIHARNILHSLEMYEVVLVDPPLVKEAIDCSVLNRLSFWDALILVSAESAKCKTLWSEDLSHDQIIRGVRIQNILK